MKRLRIVVLLLAAAGTSAVHSLTCAMEKPNIIVILSDDQGYAGVGSIIAELKKQGVYENTIVFYLTDNGGAPAMMANNAPLRGHKHLNYEGGIRVPFIVSWPAQLKGGQTRDVPVCAFDILPTVLDVLKLEPSSDKPLDGKSILPVLRGGTSPIHKHLFWNSGDGRWAVRGGEWKLYGDRGKLELYHLKKDIGEAKDLAAKERERVRELKSAYDAWLSQMVEPASGSTIKIWDPTKDATPKKNRKKKTKGEE